MINALLDSAIPLFTTDIAEGLNFLGHIVQWIVTWLPWTGVGIVLFTLILKTITLPLDAYSKVSMRKNSLKMEKMRPQLEKLQKQYQNDQQTYNAKMMELYKKNGYSMLGACLPLIVTLVVFMIVLGAFSDYSRYANLDVYREMTVQYNAAVLAYAPNTDTDEALLSYSYRGADGEILEGEPNEDGLIAYTRSETYGGEGYLIEVRLDKTLYLDAAGLSEEQLDGYDWYNTDPEKGPVAERTEEYRRTYTVKTDAVLASTDAAVVEAVQTARAGGAATDDAVAADAIKTLGRNAAEQSYRGYNSSFLWIKNIWVPDTSYRHPIEYDDTLQNSGLSEEAFNEVSFNLSDERSQANGYYILIIISIGSMFLSQFITARSQKAQSELQTADGSGKRTQRTMMIVMPIVFGVFSFFYSAGFSIYMIVSSLYSILSTLIINWIIDRRFRKAEDQEIQEKYNKRIPQAVRKANDARKGGKTQ